MRRLPPFAALRAFEAAARLGGFTQAGAELHQTPSAISHQVRALETWFGRPLFVRTVRRVTLTDEGQRLLLELSAAFDLIESACSSVRPAAQRAELAVHCAPSFASQWLGPRLRRFMQDYPSITIRLTSSAEAADLHQDGVDIDIAYGRPPARAGVEVEPLGLETTVPLCSPRLLAGRETLTPRELAGLTLIESRLNPVHWADWFRLNGARLPDRPRPSFDRGSMAVAAAVDGLGVALETTRFAEAELARGELVALQSPPLRAVQREVHFMGLRRADREQPQIARFRAWLREQLGPPPAVIAPAPRWPAR
jgi:DNA-binding transcriptional LysR family regulator